MHNCRLVSWYPRARADAFGFYPRRRGVPSCVCRRLCSNTETDTWIWGYQGRGILVHPEMHEVTCHDHLGSQECVCLNMILQCCLALLSLLPHFACTLCGAHFGFGAHQTFVHSVYQHLLVVHSCTQRCITPFVVQRQHLVFGFGPRRTTQTRTDCV